MGKALFITHSDVHNASYGGASQCSRRNYDMLCNSFGEKRVEIFYLFEHYYPKLNFINKLKRRINLLSGKFYGLSTQNEKQILNILYDKQFVFIDSSRYGRLAKLIKKSFSKVYVISFFHNAEFENLKNNTFPSFFHKLLHKKVFYYNEKCACLFSDFTIALNCRDADCIKKHFNCSVTAVIPISLPNQNIVKSQEKISEVPVGLFLGAFWNFNVSGIEWFIKNVLPYVNMKLQIIGKDMDKLNLRNNDKLEIFGYVADLREYMDNADFMIFPIFLGSGMKVKTCEALMYGKNIIGTNEAFEGYDIDFEKVGACCETAEEFIAAINEFPKKFEYKFNEYSKKVFLEKYSNERAFALFTNLLQEVKNNA